MKENKHKKIEDSIRDILGDNFKSVDFYYCQGKREVIVTYVDFKPEPEVKGEIIKRIEEGWDIILQREYSQENIMRTMLDIYNENRIAIVDCENGELKPYTVRSYVNRIMSNK